jgi:VWFA-related protein
MFRRLASLAMLLVAVRLQGQEEARLPTFPSGVQIVTVDAVVLDEQGRAVRGLTAQDFALTEDGKAQDIASFEAFDLAEEAEEEPGRPSPVATNLRPARGGARAFVVLVDDNGLSPSNLPPLAQALQRFLGQGFIEGDEVTLATTSGSLWWSVRLPEGREDLQALVARIRGGRLAESASDFLSEWEAYRIDGFESGGEVPSGSSLPGSPAMARASIGGLTGRVVQRWIESHVCAPENPGACAQMVRMRAREKDSLRRDRTRAVMAGIERAVFSLSGVRGRKELLFFSEGFLHDLELPVVKDVAGICREANVVVNFLDTRGLIASMVEGTAASSGGPPVAQDVALVQLERTVFEREGSASLAEDTGGLAIVNSNDFAAGARRIVDESRVYYLLGYAPPAGKGPRDWRKLKVEVRRAGLQVRARKGYTLRPPPVVEASAQAQERGQAPEKEKRDKQGKGRDAGASSPGTVEVARALLHAHDADGIPLRTMAYVFDERSVGRTRVLVAVEADAAALGFVARDGRQRAILNLAIVATHRDTGEALRADERVELALAPGAPAGWSLFSREFDLPAGPARIRVVARDEASGRLGAVTSRFEVPASAGLRLSTPILTTDVQGPAQAGGRPLPVAGARRAFPATGILYCQVQVYGATKDPDSGAPRVEVSYVLRRASGDEVRRGSPSLIAVAGDAPVVRLLGLPLEGMAGGDYELVLRVEDKTTQRSVERVEPFRLENLAGS